MKNTIVLIFLGMIISLSVSAKKINGDVSPIFDISPDEKSLVLSISNDNESNIYMYSFETKALKQLTDKKGSYYSRPMFSPNGKQIVFLNKDLEKQKSQIAILDIETGKIKEINTTVSFVTEAIFHPNGKQIVYCASKFIGSYSPMARKAPHDIDIYTITIEGENETKITNYSAYELSSISMDKLGEKIVFECTKKDRLEGIYMMVLSDTSKTEKIEAENNPRPEIGASFYGTPYFSKDNSLISFIAPYQVYTLGLEDKNCKIVWDNTKDDEMIMAIHSRFMDSNSKLVISGLKIVNRQYASNATLMIVNLADGKSEELKIE